VPASLRRLVADQARHRCGYCLTSEALTGTSIVGKTPVGRATIEVLGMNDPLIIAARSLWVRGSWWPPED
jgi:hypothetical protein